MAIPSFPKSTRSRLPALDGLRAFAALCVLAFHANVPGLHGGFIGVDVFFVLSGFLITTLLREEAQRTGEIDYFAFLTQRFLRLFPLLFVVTVTTCLALRLFSRPDFRWSELVFPLLYLSDFSAATWQIPRFMNHTWSLSVEAHFYLLWPFVILFIARWNNRKFLIAVLSLYLLATVWRLTVLGDQRASPRVYDGFDTHMSGLILGAALAAIPYRPTPRTADVMSAVALAVLAAGAFAFRIPYVPALSWGETDVEVAAVALIMGLTTPGAIFAEVFDFSPFVVLGLWSYGIYLWHLPIYHLAKAFFPDRWAALAATLIGAISAAALTYTFIEKPVTAFRRRIRSTET